MITSVFVRNRKSPVIALRIYCSQNPGAKGINRRGLYRMKQFYETYKDDEPFDYHVQLQDGGGTASLYGTLSSGHVGCFGRMKN